MKHIFTILTLILASLVAFSQAPNAMSYQAVIRDANNDLVSNQSVGMQISILQGSANGSSVYTETQTVSTNDNGLVSVAIGEGTTSDDFSSVDWANGPYFIKTETDPTGGSNYTITGTSQLLSVPYAMHAKTAENTFSGDYNDLSNTPDLSNYDQDNSDDFDGDYNSLVNKPTIPTSTSDLVNNSGFVTTLNDDDPTNELQNLSVSPTGDTLYLQNGGFVIIPGISTANTSSGVGTYPPGTVHCTGTPTEVIDVTNPTTGKTWMDRNLGASQVATSSTDADAYGDLYQWGRAADGHQCRNSATTSTLSSTDQPGHEDFILNNSLPKDWRSPQNENLWQGVNGTNNPCPNGYRLPTDVEWESEFGNWSSYNASGAFDSPLKLPLTGYRHVGNGSLGNLGSHGNYWSSTVNPTAALHINFYSSSVTINSSSRAVGLAIRCIKGQ